MYGRSGLSSKFSQTLIARRMTEYPGGFLFTLYLKLSNFVHLSTYYTYNGSKAQFFYGYQEGEWEKAGGAVNIGFLSDEACAELSKARRLCA